MEIFIFLIIILITNIIQGITGFAGTVLAMPFTILLLGIDVAKPVLNITTLIACILIVFESYRHIVWRECFKMIGIMFIGVLIGEYLYLLFPVSLLLTIYAIFIILIALKGIFIKQSYDLNENVLIGIIVLAGIIHGMFLSGGPLLIIYAVKKLKDKASFRATLAPVWIVLNSYLLVKQLLSGLITPQVLTLSLSAIPVLIAAILIGKKLYEHMSQHFFLLLSYILLLISGISLLI